MVEANLIEKDDLQPQEDQPTPGNEETAQMIEIIEKNCANTLKPVYERINSFATLKEVVSKKLLQLC